MFQISIVALKDIQYQELTNSDRCMLFLHKTYPKQFKIIYYHKRKLKLSNENILFAVALMKIKIFQSQLYEDS